MAQHPNSLKALRPFTPESAKRGQEASVKSRLANKAAREALRMTIKDFKAVTEDLLGDIPPAIQVLKMAMAKAIQAEDMDQAIMLATTLAEFEQPKLQRQDITQVVSTKEISDEDLAKALQEITDLK